MKLQSGMCSVARQRAVSDGRKQNTSSVSGDPSPLRRETGTLFRNRISTSRNRIGDKQSDEYDRWLADAWAYCGTSIVEFVQHEVNLEAASLGSIHIDVSAPYHLNSVFL